MVSVGVTNVTFPTPLVAVRVFVPVSVTWFR
jgi:hypothetical protein